MKQCDQIKTLLMVLICLLLQGCHLEKQNDFFILTEETLEQTRANSLPSAALPMTTSIQWIFVHICGEVHTPGVYEMPLGSRLFEVIEKAGGLSEEAAKDYLNLASVLVDGQKVIVLSKQEVMTKPYGTEGFDVTVESTKPIKVNINSATKEQLMTLVGVGAAKAEAIIQYRTEHGLFKKIEDIMQIPGIKEAAFLKIKDAIVVE